MVGRPAQKYPATDLRREVIQAVRAFAASTARKGMELYSIGLVQPTASGARPFLRVLTWIYPAAAAVKNATLAAVGRRVMRLEAEEQ